MVFLIHRSGSYRPAYISKTENSPINWLFSICFLFYRPKVSSRWCECGRVGRHHIITHFKLSHTDIHGFFGIHLQTLHGRCEVCRLLQDEVQRCACYHQPPRMAVAVTLVAVSSPPMDKKRVYVSGILRMRVVFVYHFSSLYGSFVRCACP